MAQGNSDEERARNFLKENGAVFGVPKDLSGVMLVRQTKTFTGSHFVFQQTVGGIPVEGALLAIHLDPSGAVTRASGSFIPNLNPTLGTAISKDRAMQIVNWSLKRSSRSTDRPKISSRIYATRQKQTQAWEVLFTPGDRPGVWRFLIDSLTGEILATSDMAQRIGASAQVFDPNPIKVLDDNKNYPFSDPLSGKKYSDYPDQKGGQLDYFTGAERARVYSQVALPSFYVDGDETAWLLSDTCVITNSTTSPSQPETIPSAAPNSSSDPTIPATYSFVFTRADPRFATVNAYYHIDAFRRYILDPKLFNNRPDTANPTQTFLVPWRENRDYLVSYVEVQAHDVAYRDNDPLNACLFDSTSSTTYCYQNQAFYDASSPALHFFNGGVTDWDGVEVQNGVDTAEDADVVLHEYGHPLYDGAIPGGVVPNTDPTQNDHLSRSMGEGFCDYQAAMWAEFRGRAGRDSATVEAWMAAPSGLTGDTATGGPVRRLDSVINFDDFLDPTYNPTITLADGRPEYRMHIYTAGEIWSSALWEIKKRVGFRVANRAIYEHHYWRNDKFDSMASGAQALLDAHDFMDYGRCAAQIRSVFVQKRILPPSSTDTTGPTRSPTAKAVNPTTILVTFDEPLSAASITMEKSAPMSEVDNTGTLRAYCPAGFVGQTENVTVATLSPAARYRVSTVGLSSPVTMTVRLRDPIPTDATPQLHILEVADVAGNPTRYIEVGATDGIPPKIVSAAKSGTNTIDVTFSESVQVPSATAFRVSGIRRTVTGVNYAGTSLAVLRLTLSTNLTSTERPIVMLTGRILDLANNALNAGPVVVAAP